ncbi:MAG: hypothetical protein HZA32_16800 [Opitutae bacterium]|nr:hypothetical protein [Opitutae bacterium]
MPTIAEQNLALDRLHTRACQCFTLMIWITKFRPVLQPGNEDGYELLTLMSNASIETSLLSFRCLNEFFRKRDGKHRADDVVAEDFYGFVSAGPFLSEEESRAVNKRVMHLTYHEIPLNQIGWQIADWTTRGIPRVVEFLEHLTRTLPATDAEAMKANRTIPHLRILMQQTAELAAHQFSNRAQVAVTGPQETSATAKQDTI